MTLFSWKNAVRLKKTENVLLFYFFYYSFCHKKSWYFICRASVRLQFFSICLIKIHLQYLKSSFQKNSKPPLQFDILFWSKSCDSTFSPMVISWFPFPRPTVTWWWGWVSGTPCPCRSPIPTRSCPPTGSSFTRTSSPGRSSTILPSLFLLPGPMCTGTITSYCTKHLY